MPSLLEAIPILKQLLFCCTATKIQRSLASLCSGPWSLQANFCPHSFNEMGCDNSADGTLYLRAA